MARRRNKAHRKNTRRKHRKRRRNKRGGSDSQKYIDQGGKEWTDADWLGASPDKYGPTKHPIPPTTNRTPDAWKTFYKQRETFFKSKCKRDKAGHGVNEPEYWENIDCDNVKKVLEHELDEDDDAD